MAAYDTLRAAIDSYIKANGNKEITGTVLNDILNAMVSALGADTRFAGVAVPTTNPGNPEGNVVYFASQAGTYSNFGGIVLPLGIHILVWNGTAWTSQTWFSVDNTPTQNSQNLATSGGILQAIVDAVGVERLRAIGAEVTSCSFDGTTKKISFFNSADDTLFQLDATAFVIDGMVSDVKIEDGNLVIQFNTDAGKQDIEIPLTDIFNPANYYTKTAIDALLTAINNKLADGCLYRGMAEPTTNPPTPTTKVFYIATKAGTYTNFGNIAVTEGITILKYDGSNWSKEQISYSDGVFDISAYNGTSYADLSAALGNGGANIPQNLRKGGMSVKYVQSSDNKYVQYRLMNQNWSTVVTDWQGVDDVPTAGSDNLVKSGGVSKYLTNNIITGKGDAFSSTQIHGLISGQSYKITLKVNVWSTQGMTPDNYLFAIQNFYNGTRTDIVHLNVSEIANLKKEYVITVPNNSDYIVIGARYPNGQNLDFCINPFYDQFKGTIATTAEVDNAKESGIYKMAGGTIILVTKYSASNINQAKISVTSEGNLTIQNRIFNGTSWGAWKTYQNEYDFRGNFSSDSDLDSLYGADKAGIYKNDVAGFLCSVRYYSYGGGTTIQTYYVTTTEGSFTIKIRRKAGSGSWSDWKNVLVDALDAFTGHYSNTLELNDIKESGCYRNENGPIVIVSKYSENSIRQLMITNISTGGIAIQYRDFNGTSWGNWIQYYKDIEDTVLQKALPQIISSDGLITITNDPYIAPISDPLKALSSGECNFYHEVSTGLVYVVVVEGLDHVYEASDCCSLYVFSLTNPNIVKRYQYAQKINNSKKCASNNIVPIGTKQVRVFYSIRNEDSGYCYYRDFDFNTETFTEPQKATLSITGEITAVTVDGSFSNGDVLTGNMIKTFTDDNGGTTGTESAEFVYIQKITEPMADGYRYATLSCGESISYNLVLARSNDNFASIELVAVLPYLTRYDCAVAGLNNKLYFVHRVAGDEYAATSGSALFTADITDLNNIVWSADAKFAEGDSRTDCYLYNNEIYLMAGNNHSVPGQPKRVSSSVWKGTSDNPSEYTKVLVINDSRGVQNPRVFRYGAGDYGVLMQNSPARIDYANGWTGQWQFKTATCFVRTRIN